LIADPGTLYVVATPIGNLDDMSARGREVLKMADTVAAEDTRRAVQLLTHLGLRKKLVSLHEHNEKDRVGRIMDALAKGENVALISDAGTPLISDPGYRLLAAARQRDIPVCPIPGSCAAIAALCVAGLPTDRFRFEGFLPAKAVARRKRLEELREVPETIIVYEAVHRIQNLLTDMEAVIGPDRPITLARELTKRFETIYRGSVADVRARLEHDAGRVKGEVTLVVAGFDGPEDPHHRELERVLAVPLTEVSTRQAASLAAKITGARRGDAYSAALELKGKMDEKRAKNG
jgi:16S rRNA (cytidine1402-2'-O)-methyltransferase